MTIQRHPGRPSNAEEAREFILGLFWKAPKKALLVGPVSIALGHGFGLNETSRILEMMVDEGLLRRAKKAELNEASHVGYVLVHDPTPTGTREV